MKTKRDWIKLLAGVKEKTVSPQDFSELEFNSPGNGFFQVTENAGYLFCVIINKDI